MRFATIKVFSTADIHTLIDVVEAADGAWAQFGQDFLVYSANDKWPALLDGVKSLAGELSELPGDFKKAGLRLVVQKGRAFQAEYPKTKVLLDKGRYLVTSISAAEARKLEARKDASIHVEQLSPNMVVYQQRVPADRKLIAPPAMLRTVAHVEQGTFAATIAHLVSYRTRHSTRPEYVQAAEWARDQFHKLGLLAELIPIAVEDKGSFNVRAFKAGRGNTARGLVLAIAHLDSVNHPGGVSAPAPGADDNASGSAGVITLATALAGFEFEHDIAFMLLGGEEQGLKGSEQYVASLGTAERSRIRAVLNLDMIGSVNAQPPTVLLEGASVSQSMIDGLAEAASQFTGLVVQTSLNPFASDHVPFIKAGIPAVLCIEGADGANDAIHTADDTLDRVDAGYATELLKMCAGWLVAEAVIQDQDAPRVEVPRGRISDYDCCGGAIQGDPVVVAAINQLTTHYHALFAQYTRLNNEGSIGNEDLSGWQMARGAYDSILETIEPQLSTRRHGGYDHAGRQS